MFHTKTWPIDLEYLSQQCQGHLHTGYSLWMCSCPHWLSGLREKSFRGPCLSVLSFPSEIRQLSLSTVLKCFVWNQQTSWKEHKHSALTSITIQSRSSLASPLKVASHLSHKPGGTHLRQRPKWKLWLAWQVASWRLSNGRQGVHHSWWCCPKARTTCYSSVYERENQLDPVDVEKTWGFAHVIIHAEWVIGLLRRKYTMLENTLPVDLLSCNPHGNPEVQIPMIVRIIRVCSGLVNLCGAIVPFD